MTSVGHLGGPWGTMSDFFGSLGGSLGECVTFLGHLGGPWGTMGDFFGSLGGSLGDNG